MAPESALTSEEEPRTFPLEGDVEGDGRLTRATSSSSLSCPSPPLPMTESLPQTRAFPSSSSKIAANGLQSRRKSMDLTRRGSNMVATATDSGGTATGSVGTATGTFTDELRSSSETNKSIQLIDFDGNFTSDIEQKIKRLGFTSSRMTETRMKDSRRNSGGASQPDTDYNVITVLGCQSSGKSTLLNILFGTGFPVMDSRTGRSQTTKGVWAAKDASANILVVDVEGTDSKERGEDRLTFEHRASLFSLAIADAVIVNMWYTDLGRYAAANYGLLKTVFSVNLELFASHSEKRKTVLIFVIRDHSTEVTPLAYLERMLFEDLAAIWAEIKKPSGFEQARTSDFFEIVVVGLPSKIVESARFTVAVNSLRKSLENELLPKSYSRDIPFDGLPFYAKNVWKTILSSAELDIPSQKEMVANYRCDEMRIAVLAAVTPRLHQFLAKNALDSASGRRVVVAAIQAAAQLFHRDAWRYQAINQSSPSTSTTTSSTPAERVNANEKENRVIRGAYETKFQQLVDSIFKELEKPIEKLLNTKRQELCLRARDALIAVCARNVSREHTMKDGRPLTEFWATLPDMLKKWREVHVKEMTVLIDDCCGYDFELDLIPIDPGPASRKALSNPSSSSVDASPDELFAQALARVAAESSSNATTPRDDFIGEGGIGGGGTNCSYDNENKDHTEQEESGKGKRRIRHTFNSDIVLMTLLENLQELETNVANKEFDALKNYLKEIECDRLRKELEALYLMENLSQKALWAEASEVVRRSLPDVHAKYHKVLQSLTDLVKGNASRSEATQIDAALPAPPALPAASGGSAGLGAGVAAEGGAVLRAGSQHEQPREGLTNLAANEGVNRLLRSASTESKPEGARKREDTALLLEADLVQLVIVGLRDSLLGRLDWLPGHIHERFKLFFEVDDNKVPNLWAALSQRQISQLYIKAKKEAERLLPCLHTFAIQLSVDDIFRNCRTATVDNGTATVDNENENETENESKREIEEVLESARQLPLVTESKALEIEHIAARRMLKSCQEAQFIQATGGRAASPAWWWWGLLIILGWNEAMAILRSPVFLLVSVTAAAVLGAAYYTQNLHLVAHMARTGCSLALGFVLPVLNSLQQSSTDAARVIRPSDLDDSALHDSALRSNAHSRRTSRSSSDGDVGTTGQ